MIYLLSWLFGLIWGSFANVCILRLPADESVRYPASRCPACKKPIRPLDNIPLLSYLALKGRCRHCKAPISWQYPLIEGILGAAFLVWAIAYYGAWGRVLIMDVLSFYILTISIIDYRHR